MTKHEVVYIMEPKEESVIEELIQLVDDKIREHGGKVIQNDNWGLKPMAEEVNGSEEAYFARTIFMGDDRTVRHLGNLFDTEKSYYRYMIILDVGGDENDIL